MGLPPGEYADANGWQSVGPQGNSVGKAGQSPGSPQANSGQQGAVAETLPLRDAPDGAKSCDSGFSRVSEPETQMQKIANGALFQNFTLGVIVANGLWIGFDIEWNHPNI